MVILWPIRADWWRKVLIRLNKSTMKKLLHRWPWSNPSGSFSLMQHTMTMRSGKWISKTRSLMGIWTRMCTWHSTRVFKVPNNAKKVCKLQQSIYGLKQTSRSGNLHFDVTVKEFGFIRNGDDPCVYKKCNGEHVIFLILYVDDILIIRNDPSLQAVKAWLNGSFSMKGLRRSFLYSGNKEL